MAPMSSPAGHRAMDQRWPGLFNKRLTRKRGHIDDQDERAPKYNRRAIELNGQILNCTQDLIKVVRGMTKMNVQCSKFRKVEGSENHYRHAQWQVEIKGWDFGSIPLKKPNAMQCNKHELLEALKAGTVSFIGPTRPSGVTLPMLRQEQ